jgi:gluconokinase
MTDTPARRGIIGLKVRPIVVMGVSGCGKSTLAAALAANCGAPFLEADSYHPERNVALMARGVPLTDADRWPWLDRLGAALGEAARAHGSAIAACSALKRAYRQRLAQASGLPIGFLCLAGEPGLIRTRMERRQGHYMPASLLASQLEILELPGPDEDALILDLALPLPALIEQARTFIADDKRAASVRGT